MGHVPLQDQNMSKPVIMSVETSPWTIQVGTKQRHVALIVEEGRINAPCLESVIFIKFWKWNGDTSVSS